MPLICRRTSDNGTGKCCGLGPAGFPNFAPAVAIPAVSHYTKFRIVIPGLDYHLVHTVIPVPSQFMDSLEVFLHGSTFP